MKILQLCKKVPYPIKDGEVIAITNLAKAMKEAGCELDLLCMNTGKHYFDISEIPAHFNYYKSIESVDMNTSLTLKGAFLNLFTNDSYHISRFVSDDFKEALIKKLKTNQYDLVQMETLFLAPYCSIIKEHSSAKIAMRAHNVEHEIWQRITLNTSFLPKKSYLQYLTTKLKKFEQHQLQNYDFLVPITERDKQYFQKMGYAKQSVVTPIGIEGKDYTPDYSSYQNDLSISFIGSLDWMPNLEGLKWFLEEIWTKMREEFPNLRLHIAGRNTPDWMYELEKQNIVVHGEVPDAHTFINAHSIMIVPLLSGSGMRVKILEGMALGKVVLTTSIGLEGIEARHQKEVLIADTVADFIQGIQYCYQQKQRLQDIGQRAEQLIATKYDNLAIANRLVKAYKSSNK